jgi:hypothetical protein
MESYKGHYKVHHGGNVSGFSSQVVLYPNDKLGIIVLTNQNSSLLPYIITNVVANRLLALPKTPLDQYPIIVQDIHSVEPSVNGLNLSKKPTHNLTDFCGRYLHKGYGMLTIVQKKGTLFAVFPKYTFRLEHRYHNVFVARATSEIPQVMDPGFVLDFPLNEAGGVFSVAIGLQSEPVPFMKQPAK